MFKFVFFVLGRLLVLVVLVFCCFKLEFTFCLFRMLYFVFSGLLVVGV